MTISFFAKHGEAYRYLKILVSTDILFSNYINLVLVALAKLTSSKDAL